MNKLIAVIFTTILLLVSNLVHAVTPWRTTYFEVFMGSPYQNKDGIYAAAVENGLDPDSSSNLCGWLGSETGCEQVVAELELFLHELAIEFQKDGFPDPTINQIDSIRTDENGREVVRVYLYDFGTPEPLAGFRNKCDGSGLRHLLELNSVGLFNNGKVSDRGYQSAAHELFHAVQLASNFRKGSLGCNIGKWITEGTADAVGFDYAKKLRGIRFSSWRGGSTSKPWGFRAYNEPLNKKWPGSDTSGYQTMSFWRHLAEWDFAKKRGPDHPGSVAADTDYSYLAKLFSTRQAAAGKANELKWLDSWMKSYASMQVGLAPIYAQFNATFAGLNATRLANVAGVNIGAWPKGIYGECEEVRVSFRGPPARKMIRLREAATRCISLLAVGDGDRPIEVVIQNNDVSKQKQKQLYIGAEGGLLVSSADIQDLKAPVNGAEEGESYAWWRVLVYPNIPHVFTISNMAQSAQDTKATSPILHFSLPKWSSSSSPGETPSGSSSAGGQQGNKIKTPSDVAARQKSLLTNPTTQSAMAAMSGSDFKPTSRSCKPENLTRNLCGPKVGIYLSEDFGAMPGQGPIGSTGGLLKQTGALQAVGGVDESKFMTQIQDRLDGEMKGRNISLSLPMFKYGFTGGVGNALIEVSNKVVDGIPDTLISVETVADPDGVYAPNGMVSITEYTPEILRGTFQAQLVSRVEMRKAQSIGASPPILSIAEPINGAFTVSAPWRGNGAQPDMSTDGAMMTGMRNDMMDFLMKMPDGMRSSLGDERKQELCRLEFTDQQLQILGIGGSCGNSGGPGAVGSMACNCDCETWTQVQQLPGCRAECEPEWKDWQCGPYLETGLGELDAETRRYQAELSRLDFSENAINGMVYGFKIATPEMRVGIWKDVEQYKVQQAETDLSGQIATIEAEQDKRGKNYDAETLRYSTALEQAGYSPTEVSGLTEIFAPAPAVVRKAYWDAVNARINAVQ